MDQVQRDEWNAWREIVAEYEHLAKGGAPLDFNDPKLAPMVARIKRWGVLYHRLRVVFPDVVEKADSPVPDRVPRRG